MVGKELKGLCYSLKCSSAVTLMEEFPLLPHTPIRVSVTTLVIATPHIGVNMLLPIVTGTPLF